MSVSFSEASNPAAQEAAGARWVVFTLAACELAVEIQEVREIIRVSEITLMPKAPKFLEGIINLRGRIFPILDLKRRFEMPLTEKTEESRILVVERDAQWLGLLVDKVVEVLRVNPAAVTPPLQPVLNIPVDFMTGLLDLRDRLIVSLNLEKTFHLEDLKTLGEPEVSGKEGKGIGH
jgi:purine-binding chemotaxis protein CheW